MLPVLAHYYHIPPWEAGKLTDLELKYLMEWLPKRDDK